MRSEWILLVLFLQFCYKLKIKVQNPKVNKVKRICPNVNAPEKGKGVQYLSCVFLNLHRALGKWPLFPSFYRGDLKLREYPSISDFPRFLFLFLMNECWILLKAFSVIWRWLIIMWHTFLDVFIVCNIDRLISKHWTNLEFLE